MEKNIDNDIQKLYEDNKGFLDKIIIYYSLFQLSLFMIIIDKPFIQQNHITFSIIIFLLSLIIILFTLSLMLANKASEMFEKQKQKSNKIARFANRLDSLRDIIFLLTIIFNCYNIYIYII